LHFKNILRWDGGTGENSGQLSWDIPDLGLRCTSELDLLYAGPSPDVIHETDFKSGFMKWNCDKVFTEFQFNFHAWLLFHNYPDIKAVSLDVWATRFNQRTYPVLFKREQLYNLDYLVRSAAVEYVKNRDKAPELCEAWPTVEKCEYCPAAALCDASRLPQGTPEEWVDKLVSLEAQAGALAKLAAAHVKKTGQDIVTPLGNAYGLSAPKRTVAPKMKAYESSRRLVADEGTEADGEAA
jgi:hypothetical protein